DGADEASGPFGHHGHHVGAGIDEAAAHLDRLVGGYAATHTEDDPPSVQVAHRPLYLMASSASPGRAKVILSAAVSSRAMGRGLRETDATCGGTMAPSPSPSWLKYELICRPRLAARLTRVNF